MVESDLGRDRRWSRVTRLSRLHPGTAGPGAVAPLGAPGVARAFPVLLILFGVIAYGNSLNTPFVFDDHKWIVSNPDRPATIPVQ